jgi:hypothetical protein
LKQDFDLLRGKGRLKKRAGDVIRAKHVRYEVEAVEEIAPLARP